MEKKIKCIRMNLKRPIVLCVEGEQVQTVTNTIETPSNEPVDVTNDVEGDFKRAFSVRLGEAVKGVAFGKKSIQNIEKPKRKRRRRKKAK